MIRFGIAMALFVALAALAWATLSDQRIRGVTLLLLAMFALKTWLHHRREQVSHQESESSKLESAGERRQAV